MPDRRTHRGPHPGDAKLFAPDQWPRLRQAVADLSWLLDRGYSDKAGLKLVGDRYGLRQRQRLAVMRSACSRQARDDRRRRELSPRQLDGQPLCIDGYNVLTTIEAALAGGILLLGCDGCLRDMASMHGTFRTVRETIPAVKLLGSRTHALGVARCLCYLDQPVSNSGRLKSLILQTAAEEGWNWQVELVLSPDRVLAETDHVVASADSAVLDRCGPWFNLARDVVGNALPHVPVVDLAV